jgi:hypothetical protein
MTTVAEAIAEAEKTKELINRARAAGLTLAYIRPQPDRPRFVDRITKLKPPATFVIADVGSHDDSFGPAGFDMGSLCVLRTATAKVVINSSGASAQWYAIALTVAFFIDRISVIVETTERHAADWLDFFGDRGEQISILNIISPLGGHA